MPHTYRPDNSLRFGDAVMLKNCLTNGWLVCDMGNRITSSDEAYAVTTTEKAVGACARSVYHITRGSANQVGNDDLIRYGQEVRLQSNEHICNKPLYLSSQPISPLAFARFSRNQEVCLHCKSNYNTVWKIWPVQGTRVASKDQPVSASAGVTFEHCATTQLLSNDRIAYRNDFGNELEVSCMSAATKRKTQMLACEYNGERVRENESKAVDTKNFWTIELSQDPASATPVEAPPRYEGAQMIQDIKDTLKRRGAMAIRGIGRVFRILDDNRNRQLDANELMWGLKDFDIHLNEEQVQTLIKFFDRDNSGSVNFDEFLVALRGELTPSRIGYIRQAYNKLDINGDGQVTLDDIAQIYDVSKHPDVIDGKKTPEEAYREFMSLWDTQNADGIVTFDEFCQYYKDVSASIDTDEYFGVMMTQAWKL